MAIIGVFTDLGIKKARDVQNGEGFRIFPESFAVSKEVTDGYPTIDSLRTLTEANSDLFFTGPIASRTVIDTNEKQSVNFSETPDAGGFSLRFENQATDLIPFSAVAADVEDALNALTNINAANVVGDFTSGFEITFVGVTLVVDTNQLEAASNPVSVVIETSLARANAVKISCEIPPGQAPLSVSGQEDIREVYIFAKDSDDNSFLLAVGRPENTTLYDNQGQTTFRLTLRLLNSDFSSKLVFQFTQSTEIETHNSDPNSHQNIRDVLEKSGIFEQEGSHEFIGQHFDEFATGPNRMFHASVLSGDLVYLDTDGRYKRALADGTIRQRVVGAADLVRGQVYVNGIQKIQTGYQQSTLLYLHPTSPGQVTDIPSGKPIGQALDGFNVILRVESQSQTSEYITTVVSGVPGFNHHTTIQAAINATPEGGWIRVDELEELVSSPISSNGKQVNILFTGISSGVKRFLGRNEIQTITFSATPDSGDFTLIHDANKTSRLSWDSSVADIKSALESLPSINEVNVTGDFDLGFTIEFIGTDSNQNQTQIALGVSPGVDEVQRLSFDSDDFASGSFELGFQNQQTSAIAFNQVTTATIQNQLNNLLNTSDIAVTLEPSPPAGETEFLITFQNSDGKQDQQVITIENNSLQDSSSVAITGTNSTETNGELPDTFLFNGAFPVTGIGNILKDGAPAGPLKAFDLDADGIQIIGLGRLEGFDTAIDLNAHLATRIEMYFLNNIINIERGGSSFTDFNTEGSLGLGQNLIEDTSFRDLVKVTAQEPTATKILEVSSSEITLSDGSKHGFIIDNRVSSFAGGTIDFNSGLVSGGVDFPPYTASTPNHYYKYAVMLKPNDELFVIAPIDDSANANTAQTPAPKNGILRAIVTVQDDGAGGIKNILNSDIVRFFDVGAFPEEFQRREFISAGGASTFNVSSGGTGDNFTFQPDNAVVDIEVFLNGVLQTQDRNGGLSEDYRKVSPFEIEFSDGEGNPYVVPASARITVKYKDNIIDRFNTGVAQGNSRVAVRTSDGVSSIFSLTPEILNISSNDSVFDIEVYVGGQRQTQGLDYTKISNTEIQFIDGAAPYNLPPSRVLVQARDYAVGSGSNGNVISARSEGILQVSQVGGLDFVGPYVEASETSPGNVQVHVTAEQNEAENIGTGSEVFKQRNGQLLQMRRIKGLDGVVVTQTEDDICISLSESPYYVTCDDKQVGLNIALPAGRIYDQGLNRLGVWRNGIRLVQSFSAGGLVDRYFERSRANIELLLGASPVVDVLHYVNEGVSPVFQVLISALVGNVITLPAYSIGSSRLKVWRNGLLMTTSGFGAPTDRYAETSTTSITLAEDAIVTDYFLVEYMLESPDFREDKSNLVGSVVPTPNFVVGDDKMLVFRNGKLMINSDKFPNKGGAEDRYSETSATSVTFSVPLDLGDWVTFIRKL